MPGLEHDIEITHYTESGAGDDVKVQKMFTREDHFIRKYEEELGLSPVRTDEQIKEDQERLALIEGIAKRAQKRKEYHRSRLKKETSKPKLDI